MGFFSGKTKKDVTKLTEEQQIRKNMNNAETTEETREKMKNSMNSFKTSLRQNIKNVIQIGNTASRAKWAFGTSKDHKKIREKLRSKAIKEVLTELAQQDLGGYTVARSMGNSVVAGIEYGTSAEYEPNNRHHGGKTKKRKSSKSKTFKRRR